MVDVEKRVFLKGFVGGDEELRNGRLLVHIDELRKKHAVEDGISVLIHDARILQDESSLTKAEFLDKYGFVLLNAPTKVRDWDTEAESVFFPEIETIIREELMPNHQVRILQVPAMVRRRNGQRAHRYALGVHSDYGLRASDYAETVAAFHNSFFAWIWKLGHDVPFVRRTCVFNFWRTTNMKQPLQHMPLALCMPNSVREEDIIPTGITGFTPTGKPVVNTSLKYHSEQKWYWYPNMTPDEMLVFKTFECRKGEEHHPQWRSVFHAAFKDPDADDDCEERESVEHRPLISVTTDNLAEACTIS